MANHGPYALCKRIKNDENILKLIMWKRLRMSNGAFSKSLSIFKNLTDPYTKQINGFLIAELMKLENEYQCMDENKGNYKMY